MICPVCGSEETGPWDGSLTEEEDYQGPTYDWFCKRCGEWFDQVSADSQEVEGILHRVEARLRTASAHLDNAYRALTVAYKLSPEREEPAGTIYEVRYMLEAVQELHATVLGRVQAERQALQGQRNQIEPDDS